jgi:hypothetical protein
VRGVRAALNDGTCGGCPSPGSQADDPPMRARIARLAWLVLLSLSLGGMLVGCSDSKAAKADPELVAGRRFAITIYVRCGFHGASVAGKYWKVVDGPVGDGNSPPPGMADLDRGRFTLLASNLALYHSSTGAEFTLQRAGRPGHTCA